MKSVRTTRHTALFTKRPEPGRVKTRLSPALAPEVAAGLAEAMLADTLERLTASGAYTTTLVFAPPDAEPWFRERFPGADLAPQRGADLARRLASWFDTRTAERPGTHVVVGSDQPLVPAARVGEAHARLEAGADLVLGPDQGGGYYLVALRRPCPELFLEVPMSTAGMREATVEIARARGLAVELLEPDLDVDVAEDLDALRAELARRVAAGRDGGHDFPRRTHAFLERLEDRR